MTTFPGAKPGDDSHQDLKESVIDLLKQQPGVPFAVVSLAEMLRAPAYQIDIALDELEGPVDSEDRGAFVYLARSSNQVIYIP